MFELLLLYMFKFCAKKLKETMYKSYLEINYYFLI